MTHVELPDGSTAELVERDNGRAWIRSRANVVLEQAPFHEPLQWVWFQERVYIGVRGLADTFLLACEVTKGGDGAPDAGLDVRFPAPDLLGGVFADVLRRGGAREAWFVVLALSRFEVTISEAYRQVLSDAPWREVLAPTGATVGASLALALARQKRLSPEVLGDVIRIATEGGVASAALTRLAVANPAERSVALLESARVAGLRWAAADLERIGWAIQRSAPERLQAAVAQLSDPADRRAFESGVRYGVHMPDLPPKFATPEAVAAWLRTATDEVRGPEFTPTWELLPADPEHRAVVAEGLIRMIEVGPARDRARALAAFRRLPHPSLDDCARSWYTEPWLLEEDPEVGGTLGLSLVRALLAEPRFLASETWIRLVDLSRRFGGSDDLLLTAVVHEPDGAGMSVASQLVLAQVPLSLPVVRACADTWARAGSAVTDRAAAVLVACSVPIRVAFLEGARAIQPDRVDGIAAALRLRRG